jgi:hypothetical protein
MIVENAKKLLGNKTGAKRRYASGMSIEKNA